MSYEIRDDRGALLEVCKTRSEACKAVEKDNTVVGGRLYLPRMIRATGDDLLRELREEQEYANRLKNGRRAE